MDLYFWHEVCPDLPKYCKCLLSLRTTRLSWTYPMDMFRHYKYWFCLKPTSQLRPAFFSIAEKSTCVARHSILIFSCSEQARKLASISQRSIKRQHLTTKWRERSRLFLRKQAFAVWLAKTIRVRVRHTVKVECPFSSSRVQRSKCSTFPELDNDKWTLRLLCLFYS